MTLRKKSMDKIEIETKISDWQRKKKKAQNNHQRNGRRGAGRIIPGQQTH